MSEPTFQGVKCYLRWVNIVKRIAEQIKSDKLWKSVAKVITANIPPNL